MPTPAEVNFVFTQFEARNELYLKTRQGGTFFNEFCPSSALGSGSGSSWMGMEVARLEDDDDIAVPTTFGSKPESKHFR